MVTLDELEDMILAGNAACKSKPGDTGCDGTIPVIDLTNATVSNGYVTGGSYDAICQPTPDCEAVRDTSTVTAIPC